MKNKTISSTIERLFSRTGKWYPLVAFLLVQIVTTPLMILLTAMPAQDNAEFTRSQGINLLIFGSLALLFRNALLHFQFYFYNKDMFICLEKFHHPEIVCPAPQQEIRAWEQATSATKHFLSLEIIELFILVLAPTSAYGYFGLHLELAQITYLVLAATATGLAILNLEAHVLERLFTPVIHALLPQQFEAQLSGIKGVRLWMKLTFALIGLGLIGSLLIMPTAYRQIDHALPDSSLTPEYLSNALSKIIIAGIGVLVIGITLSVQLISYISTQFQKTIDLFRKVENGDLDQRMKISYADDFGELNIYSNHMIDRLQMMTTTLEQQVAERTAQLIKANKQLQIELTERKRTEAQLAYTALHDPLTNLPNRALLMDRLNHVLEHAKRNKDFEFAVFFMDLDRFKVVNDSLGHNIGDLLLIESGKRLTNCIRSEDTVARLGGDEFVILLEGTRNSSHYLQVADRVQHVLSLPTDLMGQKVFVSVSTGIVLSDDRYKRPEDILRDADIAMYRAKSRGRGRYEIFDSSMLDGVMTRLELENGLRRALENDEFIVHYQPILDLQSQRIVGFEALARWQHPTRGLIMPADFIPTAEEIGLIVPIGYWVLEKACQQISIWQKKNPSDPPLSISVNLSARQCAQSDLVHRISGILRENKLDPASLKLELTESLVVEDSASTAAMLTQLREMGVQVYIDDFGTGYSSLSYLHNLPIDTLKIDRTFISQLGNADESKEIVRTILSLAHSLGMKVIAEGVETQIQLSSLQKLNCEFMQGFLFSKPVDEQEAGAMLGKPIDIIKD